MTELRRSSRVRQSAKHSPTYYEPDEKNSILATPDVRPRKWRRAEASVGYFQVKRWVPTNQHHLTAELHGGLTEKSDVAKLALRSVSKASARFKTRSRFGSSASPAGIAGRTRLAPPLPTATTSTTASALTATTAGRTVAAAATADGSAPLPLQGDGRGLKAWEDGQRLPPSSSPPGPPPVPPTRALPGHKFRGGENLPPSGAATDGTSIETEGPPVGSNGNDSVEGGVGGRDVGYGGERPAVAIGKGTDMVEPTEQSTRLCDTSPPSPKTAPVRATSPLEPPEPNSGNTRFEAESVATNRLGTGKLDAPHSGRGELVGVGKGTEAVWGGRGGEVSAASRSFNV